MFEVSGCLIIFVHFEENFVLRNIRWRFKLSESSSFFFFFSCRLTSTALGSICSWGDFFYLFERIIADETFTGSWRSFWPYFFLISFLFFFVFRSNNQISKRSDSNYDDDFLVLPIKLFWFWDDRFYCCESLLNMGFWDVFEVFKEVN